MELFVKVYFWMILIGIILKILVLSITNYPRTVNKGMDCIDLIISVPFLIWVSYLFFNL